MEKTLRKQVHSGRRATALADEAGWAGSIESGESGIVQSKSLPAFGETDIGLITELHAGWLDVSRWFVDDFYANLAEFAALSHFIQNPQFITCLKQTRAAYFNSLAAGWAWPGIGLKTETLK